MVSRFDLRAASFFGPCAHCRFAALAAARNHRELTALLSARSVHSIGAMTEFNVHIRVFPARDKVKLTLTRGSVWSREEVAVNLPKPHIDELTDDDRRRKIIAQARAVLIDALAQLEV